MIHERFEANNDGSSTASLRVQQEHCVQQQQRQQQQL